MPRRPARVVTRELIAKVKEARKRKPQPSIGALAREFEIGAGTVHSILHDRCWLIEAAVGADLSIEPHETCEWSYG